MTATTLLAEAGHPWPGPWILFFPLAWAVAVVLIVLLLRATVLRGRRGGPWGGWAGPRNCADTPVAVLGRRYAEGAIDEAEYRARLAVLTETGADLHKPNGGGTR